MGDAAARCERPHGQRPALGIVQPQQFAVVVSNVEPDLVANVTIDEDTALPGALQALRTVATARVGPRSLEVFKLGPKEVDGSAPGTFDTGTRRETGYAEIGNGIGVSRALDTRIRAVDKDVFMRELKYHAIRSGAQK